jgi:hypothetical protein
VSSAKSSEYSQTPEIILEDGEGCCSHKLYTQSTRRSETRASTAPLLAPPPRLADRPFYRPTEWFNILTSVQLPFFAKIPKVQPCKTVVGASGLMGATNPPDRLLQADSIRRRQRGALERLDDEVHGPVSPLRTNVLEMMDLATSFVTDLYSALALFFRTYTSRDAAQAAKHGRVHTGSFTAQFCSTFERSAVGNGSPSLPRRRFGSPNMTIDLIFG